MLGAMLVELLNGELSDETIAAIDSIKREDVQGPLNNIVGMIHHMSTEPHLRQSIIADLLDEIRIESTRLLKEKFWDQDDPRQNI